VASGADRTSNDPTENDPTEHDLPEHDSAQNDRPAGPSEQDGPPGTDRSETQSVPETEVAELVGRLSSGTDLEQAERRRLLGRLGKALSVSGKKARADGTGRGKWLADVFMSIAPRLPIRDLETLQEHHYGLTGEQLADDLVRTAANATMTVGAVGGALAAAEFAAPPLLLSAPAQLVAETLVVAAIEVKLIAELHEVYGVRVPGNGSYRAAAFVTAWARQRGVDPTVPSSVTLALGAAAKASLRNRLMRTLGRHLTTLGPFLTGAVAGGTLNRIATKKVAEAVRTDLRTQRALPPA
jgi:hypothetical protein